MISKWLKTNSIKDLKYFLKDKKFKKIFLLTGKKSYHLSGANKIFDRMEKYKTMKFFFKSSPYPEFKELKKLINEIKNFNPDLIIAVGGGSVIDYAKIANLQGIEENFEKKIKNNSYKIKKKISKLLAIPTTAGSGAEVTANAVIYIDQIKYSVEGKELKPDVHFLIPELIIKNPKKLKSSAGFDAISQAVESIISLKSSNQSLIYATESLDLSLSNYLEFIKKPTLNNCKKMSIAAMLSGRAISISKTTAPHALSYPFTSLYNISHGHAVSLTLEKFLKFNFLNSKKSLSNFNLNDRYQKIFKIFKVRNIYELENHLKKLKKDAGLVDDFKKLKINIKSEYHNIIDGVNLLRLKNNPIKLAKTDIKRILFE